MQSSKLKLEIQRDQKKVIPFEISESKRLDVVLAGENAEVEIVGLVLGKLDEEKSFEAYITHVAPNTKSNVNVRGVLRGKSNRQRR